MPHTRFVAGKHRHYECGEGWRGDPRPQEPAPPACSARDCGQAGGGRTETLLDKNGASIVLKDRNQPQFLRTQRTIEEVPLEFFDIRNGQITKNVSLNGVYLSRSRVVHPISALTFLVILYSRPFHPAVQIMGPPTLFFPRLPETGSWPDEPVLSGSPGLLGSVYRPPPCLPLPETPRAGSADPFLRARSIRF